MIALAKGDPALLAYDVIIVDEAHAHSVPTDLVLGLLKMLTLKRPELKIVIMSATLDTIQFEAFFPGAKVHEVPGRAFDVEIKYTPEHVDMEDMASALVTTILHAHLTERSGDILVFVSGFKMITDVMTAVNFQMKGDDKREPRFDPEAVGELVCYPLYSGLPQSEQDDAINSPAPPATKGYKHSRKVILATNIAETSVTIPGVTIVIDSLMVKANITNITNESDGLIVMWVTKATAKQRSGRAGRVRAGSAYRMCTRNDFDTELLDHTVPEMQACNMVDECISILQMGCHPMTFPYISPPATETVYKALGTLTLIGAVEYGQNGLALTSRGEAYSRLPCDVWSGLMLLESQRFNAQDEMLSLVAMLTATEDGVKLFIKPPTDEGKAAVKAAMRHFGQKRGDHIMLLNIYMAWRQANKDQTAAEFLQTKFLNGGVLKVADATRKQLIKALTSRECRDIWTPCDTPTSDPNFYTQFICALAAGSMLRVAKRIPQKGKKREEREWETVHSGDFAQLQPGGCIPSPGDDWIVYTQFSNPSPDISVLRLVTPVPLDLMLHAMPAMWSELNLAEDEHIANTLVARIAQITKSTDEFVRRTIPAHPSTR